MHVCLWVCLWCHTSVSFAIACIKLKCRVQSSRPNGIVCTFRLFKYAVAKLGDSIFKKAVCDVVCLILIIFVYVIIKIMQECLAYF